KQNAKQRVQKYRSDLFYRLRKLFKYLSEQKNQVACDKSAQKCPKETGFALGSNHTTHKSDRKRRSVSNAHSDKPGQNREHETKCQVSDPFECRCRRGNCPESRTRLVGKSVDIYTQPVNKKGKGDQDTASYDKGKHV